MQQVDVETIKNCLLVLIVACGFLAGMEMARAFSFWKW